MRKPIGSAAVRDAAVLASVLVLHLIGVAIIDFTISPFPGDPDYIYLVNGLDMLALHAPSYFDHPGTPVQVAIAFITGITWLTTMPMHGWARKMDDVLLHSQFYLGVISAIF